VTCTVYWVGTAAPLRLGILPRPRGGDWLEDEIRSLRDQGVNVVVSLLTAEEVEELCLELEPVLCRAEGIEFLTFPIDDRDVPSNEQDACDFVRTLHQRVAQGRSVVIHCRAGIGRSATIAALVMAAHGILAEDAFRQVGDARGCAVPDTSDQKAWAVAVSQKLRG
jgi:protein-tyrosine phosphatase